jgi:putative methyltransferase (TIGR04325 family)
MRTCCSSNVGSMPREVAASLSVLLSVPGAGSHGCAASGDVRRAGQQSTVLGRSPSVERFQPDADAERTYGATRLAGAPTALIRSTRLLGFNFFATGSIAAFDESVHNAHMTLAYVLARAAHGQVRLSVLDWGGGIGYYAMIAQSPLSEITIDYVIKELPGLAALVRELMPSVSFETDETRCFSKRYDLVIASSSLQYEEDWRGVLARLAAAARKFLARVPTAPTARSFVVVQRPQRYGYDTEYLSRVINRNELLSHAAVLNLTLEREFLAGGSARFRKAPDEPHGLGFLFRVPSRVAETCRVAEEASPEAH